MPSEESGKSFWKSLPGVLTGVAGVVGAAAALFTAIDQLSGGDQAEPASARPNGAVAAETTGASDPPQTAAATTRTRADWASEANDACRAAVGEVRALGTASTLEELIVLLPRLLDLNWRLHAELDEIEPGTGDEAAVEAWLASLATAIEDMEDVQSGIQNLDSVAAQQAWDEWRVSEDRFDTEAIRLGAGQCAAD